MKTETGHVPCKELDTVAETTSTAGRFKLGFSRLLHTLSGGHQQRWKILRRLAQGKG